MADETSISAGALQRMKAAADKVSGPDTAGRAAGATPGNGAVASDRSEAGVGRDHPGDGDDAKATGGEATGGTTPVPSQPRLRHANTREPFRPRESLNDWLDGLGTPDWDKVSDAIYHSPTTVKDTVEQTRARRAEERERRAEARLRAEAERQAESERQAAERAEAKRRAEEDRLEAERRAEAERLEAERLAEEGRLEAERLAAERAEAERLAAEREEQERIRAEDERRAAEAARREAARRMELQRAEEEALRRELQEQEYLEWLGRQQERETWALQTAAREADGTDWIPPVERRPLLEQRGENLTDAQLLDRARDSLWDWRHRDRIVEKAQAIEATVGARAAARTTGERAEPAPARYIPPYNLPSLEPDPPPRSTDLVRRLTVTLAWALFVLGGLYGLGFLGPDAPGPWLQELHGGRFAGGFSMLSMASWVHLVWPVLWLAMGVYTVHQWQPSQASAERQRATGWRVAGAMAAVAVWFLIARTGFLLGVEPVVWLALTYLLVDSIHQLNLYTARSRTERLITDGMIGLFTGWAVVYAAANLSIWLQSIGVNLLWIPGSVWAVLTIIAVVWGAAMLTMTERGRMTIALGLAWGLAAILAPRLVGSMNSVWVAIMAAMGLFVVLLATENRRYRINHAEHRAALGHETEDF